MAKTFNAFYRGKNRGFVNNIAFSLGIHNTIIHWIERQIRIKKMGI